MITTGTVHGVDYYKGSGAQGGGKDRRLPDGAASYYTGATEHGEPAGQWSGRLAAELGLTGDVDDAVMEQVFERFTAPDGTPIGRAPIAYASIESRVTAALQREPNALPERVTELIAAAERSTREAVLGMDLTFSVPKSVTVAHTAAWRAEVEATAAGDVETAARFESIRSGIEGAIGEANRASLEYAASLATARAGRHGGGAAGTWVSAPDVVVASFFQHTSRADDPQLHTHNVVLNRARCVDGQIRALDTVDLRQQKHAIGAVADRVLAERLGDLGLRMDTRPDGVAREVVGIEQEVMDLFSQRRATITKALTPAIARAEEKLGRELNELERNRLAQEINLATRASKKVGDDVVDFDALLARWETRIVTELGQGLAPVADRVRAAVDAGPALRAGTFSPDAVGAEAVLACATKQAAWSRADLMLEIERRLPLLGLSTQDTVDLVHRLTDRTLVAAGAVQVSGNAGVLPPQDLVQGSYVRPSAALFAAPVTLEAENLIRRAALERRGHKLEPGAADEWLSARYPTMNADQRAAVLGIASSDAALAQIVGPAGTGKSFTAGALAGVWSEQADGTVHGLAVSQVAAEVLREDGVQSSANIAAWLRSQERLEAGAPMPHDLGRAVGPRDIVLVDEASMVGTAELDRVRQVVEAAGARIVLMGDPYQLGAVTAGGVMDLVGDRAETYTLSEVRRFTEPWEGPASLALREGAQEALGEYDRRGRLVDAASMDEAIEIAARAAAAERIAGRSVSVTADTNEAAAQIANRVREHLVQAGVVEAGGVQLPRTGGFAGIGDQVMTRHIDRGLDVLNGERYEVVGWGEDGSLSVLGEDGALRELPAAYVAEHVQHAYASTVHRSQGITVDVGFTVTDGRSEAASLYVGMTRGRERNTAIVALTPAEPAGGRLEHETSGGGSLNVEQPEARPSARAVLADAFEREATNNAALIEQERDAAQLASMHTVLGRIEDAVQKATRARMDRDLDTLVETGLLDPETRARLSADQSSEHLSRVLRAAEQAGLDPAGVLQEAIAAGSLDGSRSVAQVLSARIRAAHDVETAAPGRVAPDRLPARHAAYLEKLYDQADARSRELGGQVAEQAPAWATKALGPVPEDPGARLEWETRAGAIASYREAAGFTDADRAIGTAPGLSSTEKRAHWWDAWEALGRPEETRPEASLSDGQLQARVSAWRREQEWAPPHADASLRQAELDAEHARQEAILARAAGDLEAAERWDTEAETRAAVARGMTAVAEAREQWAANTAVTRELAERAEEELTARGLEPGHEPDRVSAEEWLEHQRAAAAAEDETRAVTELDLPAADDPDSMVGLVVAAATDDAAESEAPPEIAEHPGVMVGNAVAGDITEPSQPQLEATNAGLEPAVPARTRDLRPAPETETQADAVEMKDLIPAAVVDEDDTAAADAPEPAKEAQPSRSPAYETAPLAPTDLELEALVQRASEADEIVRDRQSEEEAHDAWEAEELAPAADGDNARDQAGAGGGSVAESVAVGLGDGLRKPWDDEA